MPDPWRYLAALTLTACVAGLVSFLRCSLLLALATAASGGLLMLRIPPNWPPTTGLDRLLLLVLPSVVVAEWWASRGARSAHGPRVARLAILTLAAPALLWDSVHLGTTAANTSRAFASSVMSVLLAITAWTLSQATLRQFPRSASRLGIVLGVSVITAGILTLLGGYLRGGATALVLGTALTTAILGQAVAKARAGRKSGLRPSEPAVHADPMSPPWLAVGLAMLHGTVFVGLHFGRLQPLQAFVLLATPCLASLVDLLPFARGLSGSLRLAIFLAAVGLPLFLLIVWAKQDFDRRMGPLLNAPGSSRAGLVAANPSGEDAGQARDENQPCLANPARRILASRPGRLHNRVFAARPVTDFVASSRLHSPPALRSVHPFR